MAPQDLTYFNNDGDGRHVPLAAHGDEPTILVGTRQGGFLRYTLAELATVLGVGTIVPDPSEEIDGLVITVEDGEYVLSNLGLGTAATKNTGYGANAIPVLTATPGTPNGTKFLRDDGTWASAGGAFPIEQVRLQKVGDFTSTGNDDLPWTAGDPDTASITHTVNSSVINILSGTYIFEFSIMIACGDITDLYAGPLQLAFIHVDGSPMPGKFGCPGVDNSIGEGYVIISGSKTLKLGGTTHTLALNVQPQTQGATDPVIKSTSWCSVTRIA